MFNVKHPSSAGAGPWLARVDDWANLGLDDKAVVTLEHYVGWLATEAVAAGAIGPDEVDRLWPRHIADSLVYAAAFEHRHGDALDIGSGAGLPGIPLAIACPGLEVTLLDRSGRRCALLRRVVRILELTNAHVREGDVDTVDPGYGLVVARAALPPEQALLRISRLLAPDGEAVIGLSRRFRPDGIRLVADAARHGLAAEMLTVPADVLDSPAWLLRMTPRERHS
jgi:16S rRNA (guanine527-N7)-methyltransferase